MRTCGPRLGTIVAHVGPPFSVEFRDKAGRLYSDQEVVAEVCRCGTLTPSLAAVLASRRASPIDRTARRLDPQHAAGDVCAERGAGAHNHWQ
jgi:hypothetical protein